MREIRGANMDIDLFPADVDWEVGKCPWNEAEGARLGKYPLKRADCHKCAEKGVSICKYFHGIKGLDSVLCGYGEKSK